MWKKKVDHSTAGALEAMGQRQCSCQPCYSGSVITGFNGWGIPLKLGAGRQRNLFWQAKKTDSRIMAIGKRISYWPHAKNSPPFCTWKGITKRFTMFVFLFRNVYIHCLVDADVPGIRKRFMKRWRAKEAAIPRLMSCASRFDQYIGQWLKRKPSADPKQELLGGRKKPDFWKLAWKKGGG